MPAMCSNAERTISSLARRCSSSPRCSQSQPPQRSLSAQGEARRFALGLSTSRSRPRGTLPPSAISTNTLSEGRAPSTKTERPSSLPTPWPDLDSRSMEISARRRTPGTALRLWPLRRLGKLLAEPFDEALDASALLVVYVDELDAHSGHLIGGIVELGDPGHPSVELEGKRGVGKGDDQPNRGSHRQRIAGVDEDAAAGDVHRPVGDEAIHAAVGDQKLVLQPIRPSLLRPFN